MSRLLPVLALIVLVLPAAANDGILSSKAPSKPGNAVAAPPPVPEVIRQGGDTIADAVVLTIPTIGLAGTTVGYSDDYDEVCPYGASTSPDVVYTTTPDTGIDVDIDLLGSTYDTKVYVYDEDLTLVACNDDFYPDFVSKLENVALEGGVQYFVIIDGYGGDAGEYLLGVTVHEPCLLDCPGDAALENEPPLVDGYVDMHNGGCNSVEFGSPFGSLGADGMFCGTSGWYVTDGLEQRDTDWFLLTVPIDWNDHIVVDAEYPTYVFELGPQDCDSVGVIQSVTAGPCAPATLGLSGHQPGDVIWIWVGPTVFDGPVDEYAYTILIPMGIATETHTLSEVKALFD